MKRIAVSLAVLTTEDQGGNKVEYHPGDQLKLNDYLSKGWSIESVYPSLSSVSGAPAPLLIILIHTGP